jgi:hypothetical protein
MIDKRKEKIIIETGGEALYKLYKNFIKHGFSTDGLDEIVYKYRNKERIKKLKRILND